MKIRSLPRTPNARSSASAICFVATLASAIAHADTPVCTMPPQGVTIGQEIVATAFASNYHAWKLPNLTGTGIPNLNAYPGGMMIDSTDPNLFYVVNHSESADTTVVAVHVVRDACGHVTGWNGDAVIVADTPDADAGLLHAPNSTFIYTRWRDNYISQLQSLSSVTPTSPAWSTNLTTLGVDVSISGLAYVPYGYTSAGELRGAIYDTGKIFSLPYTVDGSSGELTFAAAGAGGPQALATMESVTYVGDLVYPGGITYTPAGAPVLSTRKLLVLDYYNYSLTAFDTDAIGTPTGPAGTLSGTITGTDILTNAVNAWGGGFLDPISGDLYWTAWGGADTGFHVLSGFPLGECGHDSDCHGTQYCSAQTHHCLNKAVNGQSVPTDTGHADGTLDGTCTPGEAAIGCLSGVCNATNADNDSDPSNDDNHNKCGTVNGQACTQDTSCWSTLCTSGLCAPNCASDSDCETGFCDPYLTTCVPTLDNGASIPAGRGTCGTANAYGNPSAVCTSGACSANANTCIPSGGCAVNADCSTGQACQLSTFTCLLAGGGACTGNSDCTSNFCDTAGGNLCGYANGSSGCTTNTEAGDCQSNTCSSDGFCIPPGGCHVDTECSAGEYCAQSTYACTTDIAAGGALPNDGLHGTCSAGLNAACASGECNATTTTCAQDNGTACTNANQCVVNICGTNNLCGLDAGQAGCDVNTAATVCQSGACSQNGDCLTPGDCLVDGDCSASQYCDLSTQQCAALPTSGSSSGGGNTSGSGSSSGGGNTSGSGSSSGSGNATCATDSACPSGQWCNQGTCQAQLPAGQAIPSDAAHGGTCNADNAHALCVTGACNAVTATCGAVNNTSCAVAGECITNTCFSDGRCGLPANQQCTSDTQCRNGICVSGLCNAEAAAVATGRGLLSCSSAGGASRASVIEWALLVLLVIGARKKKRLVMSVALLVCFAATTAFSAERGFDLDRYTPADPGSRWLEAESLSSPGGALGPDRSSVLQSITLRLDFEWAHDPLVVRASGTNILSHVVENQLVGHLAASVSPIARLRLSLALPVQLWADGKTATDRSHDLAAPQAAGLGDIRLGATFRFYGEEEGRVRVGASGRLWIPSGSTAAYIGDGTVSGALSVTAAGDESWFAWSATLGARWRESTRFTYASTAVGPEAFATLAAGGQTADHRVLVGLEVPLASTLSAHAPFSSTEFSVEPGIGVHWRFVDGWRAHAAVNTGLTEALGSPLVRTMLAIEWAPAPAEKKWTPEPEPLVAPPPPPPPPASAPASEPASLPASIPVAELDSDGDGIPDSQDACPNDAGQNHSSARTNGCPMAFIKDGQIVLAEHIKFASGRAEIIEDEESNNLLNALMSTIQAHPEIARLRVIGYTDDRGPRAKNITISRQRAAAVVKWLTAHGIAASRLESVGKGPDDPITSNDTEDGRRENRRVEFKIL